MQHNKENDASIRLGELVYPAAVTAGGPQQNADRVLELAREFYASHPNAPRSIAEASDEFQVQLMAGKSEIVGTEDAPWSETTRQAIAKALPNLGIIQEDVDDDGHGSMLIFDGIVREPGPGVRATAKLFDRLMLVRWSSTSSEHIVSDVSDGVRIESCDDYNETVAAQLQPSPNGDGSFGHPEGQVRYAIAAGAVQEGHRIVFGGLTRTVISNEVDTQFFPTVHIELSDGSKILVPRDLEITYVDHAG